MTENTLQILGLTYEIAKKPATDLYLGTHGFSLSFDLFYGPESGSPLIDISKAESYSLTRFGSPNEASGNLGHLISSEYLLDISEIVIIQAGDRDFPLYLIEYLTLRPSESIPGIVELFRESRAGSTKVAQINLAAEHWPDYR